MVKTLNVLFDIEKKKYFDTKNVLYALTYGTCLQHLVDDLTKNDKINLTFSDFKSTQNIRLRKLNVDDESIQYNFNTKNKQKIKRNDIQIIYVTIEMNTLFTSD